MAEIKYQYANNENGEIVSINDLTKEESKSHTFKCISCGNTLIPRAIGSKSRRPHFYHKELVECNGETYLHELGKSVIKKKFVESDTFFISYDATIECDNKTCDLRNSFCSVIKSKIFNLKSYYDTCSIEVPVKGYVADLLLKSSQKDIPPVLIEICVTHQCTEEKRTSGLRIIEIRITGEKDIDALKNCRCLECNKYKEKDFMVEFFNFKSLYEERLHVTIKRVSYTPSIDETVLVRDIRCDNVDSKFICGSKYEYNVLVPNLYNKFRNDIGYIFLQWLGRHKRLRMCRICKFYYATDFESSPICRLSKKYNTPTYPEKKYADRCRYFHQIEDCNLESYKFSEVVGTEKMKEPYRVIIAGSSSFHNYQLLRYICDFYLSEKLKTHAVILLVGTSSQTEELVVKYAEERSIFVDHFAANWDKYGQQNAVYQSYEKQLSKANALIAFWDGKSTYTGELIKLAKSRNVLVECVRY